MTMLHFPRKPKGYVLVAGPEGNTEGETLQCCHCGRHWRVEPGSGRRRGFCFRCNAVTCGANACDTCLPYEKRIEMMERKR